MNDPIDIRPYEGREYELHLLGFKRKMPLYRIKKDLWIAANEHLSFGCDVEFTKRVAGELFKKLKKFKPDCLFSAEAKATALTYELAKRFGHREYAIARKALKENIKGYISVSCKSISARNLGRLLLSKHYADMIAHRRIALIDDCISTGSTISSLINLALLAKAKVVAIASIWLEGAWPFEKFKDEIDSGSLIYLDTLPIFAKGKMYQYLLEQKKKIEAILK